MARPDLDPAEFVRLSKDYAELEPVVRAASEVEALRGELADLESMLADPEMKAMAEEEIGAVRARLPEAEHGLAVSLLPKDSADQRPALLEIRAGTGGDEGGSVRGRPDAHVPALCRDARLEGRDHLSFRVRAGRLQGSDRPRSPAPACSPSSSSRAACTASSASRPPRSGGRIHTSAATVAVLPEAEEVDVQINEATDLRIDVYRASGSGGQHVNTTDSAVRITHLPTGLVVTQQDEKSQHKNKAKALKVLRTRLYEAERERTQAEHAGARKAMVGSGDRSERIRTYNFPQGRVTDHRINLTLHRLPEILEGPGLDEVISALVAEDEAARLAQLDLVS